MPEPVEVTDEEELVQAAEIRRRLGQAPIILARYERLPAVPALGSDVAGDDIATAWMTSSHLVNATLLMAADNMRALGVLLFPNDRLSMPLYAHYPILRSILEASALVKWLLEPEEQSERVTRMLRTRWSDSLHDRDLKREEVATVKAMANYDTEEVSRAEAAIAARYARDVAKIREIAEAFSIPHAVVKRGIAPWVHMVRAVCTVEEGAEWIAVPGEYAASTWRALSGLSHPSYGGVVNSSSMQRIADGSSDGTLLARFSADLGVTQRAIEVAWNTTQEAIELVEQRYGTRR